MNSFIKCGDAYELIKELPDNSVDLVITDPPYEIGEAHGSGIMKDSKTIAYLKEIEAANIHNGFDFKLLDELVRVLKKINIYIFCSKLQIPKYLDYFKNKNCNFEILILEKDNPPPLCGTHYLVDKEFCLFFWETGAYLHTTYKTGRTVFRFKTNEADKEIYNHPTIKQITMIETLIENSSQSGGVILDPFLGSGTTARAAKNLGRKYIGYEINPTYFKIADDRLKGINQKGELNLFELD